MSVLKPKDQDYISRGCILILVTLCLGCPPLGLLFGQIGFILGGTGWALGLCFVGILSVIPLSLWLFDKYLDFGFRVITEKKKI